MSFGPGEIRKVQLADNLRNEIERRKRKVPKDAGYLKQRGELIADGHHVSSILMKMLFHAKGPSGICLVTDATAGAGLANGERFSLGGLECLIENGACLLVDRSARSNPASAHSQASSSSRIVASPRCRPSSIRES
jgi:N-acetylglucosamine-6-phosphate deacetylase